nr:MAG TPA: Head fiber protein [Caudoviricetes sp.]
MNLTNKEVGSAEIEPSKLVMPFSENDKANTKGWFEFNE